MRIRQAVVWGLLLACAGSMVQAQAARLADGTTVRVRLTADLVSAQVTIGTRVNLEVAQPVMLQGVAVIPAGSVAWGAVQEVKQGKLLRIDIEGVRLPNLEIVRLRCSPQRTTKVVKDEIKIETQVGSDLGARKGSEFIAYLDQDVNIDVAGAPAAPRPATPAPAAVEAPAPAAVATSTPPAETSPTPAPATPPPVVTAPVASAAPTAAPPAVPAQPGELITVECFSDPLGADIQIDDEFHGSTPSILKLPPGNHQIEFRLMGYKPHSQALNLMSGTGLRTVRVTLEKQP